jgi:polysaccharide deacetylase family protein (PEP-CTERM system associated)
MKPDEFREDTRRAIEAIQEATGIRPRGYRAPSWSLSDKIPWAFEMLADMGFEYDSSIFPIKHDLYGMPRGPRSIFRMKFDNDSYLYEVPASTFRLLGKNFPIAGGGYLRHMPYWYTRAVIRHLNRRGQPAVVYVHPWEIDPEPPQLDGLSMTQRLRSYGSTSIMGIKLSRLLKDFHFTNVLHFLESRRRQRIGFQ